MSNVVLENLSEEECLSLLRTVEIGRVAVVTADGRPEIFPVNFVVHERTVAFRTGSPTILARAPLGHIAFEADQIDTATREAWDVVVSGEGADVTDSLDQGSTGVRSERVQPWAPGHNDRWIAMVNPTFHGRRLYAPAGSPLYF